MGQHIKSLYPTVCVCVCVCVRAHAWAHMQAIINIIQITYNNHQYVLLWGGGSLKLQFCVRILNRQSITL